MKIHRSRLLKPHFPHNYVGRSRLLDKMRANSYKKVHKIIAPAGYGKSMFISQWLDETGDNLCWINLEADCNDLHIFLDYLMQSIIEASTEDLADLNTLRGPVQLPVTSEVANIITNVLHQITLPTTLVLDDFHMIKDGEVILFLNELLKYFPQQHNIVIISRIDPPLDLAKLDAYDKVNEIRMSDLKFKPQEIRALSEKIIKVELDYDTSVAIYDRTEGWIIAIRMILKEIVDERLDRKQLNLKSTESETLIFDLLEDMLMLQELRIKEVLFQAALFPRFNIELLQSLCNLSYDAKNLEDTRPDIFLKSLTNHFLFIIRLGERGDWFRYHHLVKDFLTAKGQRELSDEVRANALDLGSSFFASKDEWYEAITLAIEAGNFPKAIAYFNRIRSQLLEKHRFDQLKILLKLFPEEIVDAEPGLLLIRAAIADLSRKDDEMMVALDRVRDLLPPLDNATDTSKVIWGEYYSTIASLLYRRCEMKRLIQYSYKAMELLDDNHRYLYDHALSFCLLGLAAMKRDEEAREFLRVRTRKLAGSDVVSRMNCSTISAIVCFTLGKLNDCKDSALAAIRLNENLRNPGISLISNYYASVVYYQRDDLAEGLQHITKALEIPFTTRPSWVLECYYLKVLHLCALHDYSQCQEALQEMISFSKLYSSESYSYLVDLIRIEFHLSCGEMDKAWEIWRNIEPSNTSYSYHYFQSTLTRIKLLIAEHPLQDLDKAETLINQYEARAAEYNFNFLRYQLNALRIVLLSLKNESDKAAEALTSLLTKTKQDSIIRLYTDSGRIMQSLIDEVPEDLKKDPYVFRIAQSFKKPESVETQHDVYRDHQPIQVEYGEISNREIQILHLISEGYQNKEIANELFYSTGTVKTYIYKIYQKIGIKNRAQAIDYYHKLLGNSVKNF